MALIRSLQELSGPGQGPRTLMALGVALAFAAIFLFGGRPASRLGQVGLRRFLSFAAGIAVAYTFVHLLPTLHLIQQFHTSSSPAGFQRVFPEHTVYLWTMAGFLGFYGLETMGARPQPGPEPGAGHHGGAAPWRAWVHIGGFALYAWLLAYMMVRTGKGIVALAVFAGAMGMHFFPIVFNLRTHYPEIYNRGGAFLLALAPLAGWACSLTLDIPNAIVLNLAAIVAGGVIVNSAIAELPKEKEGRFWCFLIGAVVYTALLMILSRFENHG